MKSAIFNTAAQIIDANESRYACLAICRAHQTLGGKYKGDSQEELFFQDVFQCKETTFFGKLYLEEEANAKTQPTADDITRLTVEAQEMRVIALLLAAELIKSEKKSYYKSKYKSK